MVFMPESNARKVGSDVVELKARVIGEPGVGLAGVTAREGKADATIVGLLAGHDTMKPATGI